MLQAGVERLPAVYVYLQPAASADAPPPPLDAPRTVQEDDGFAASAFCNLRQVLADAAAGAFTDVKLRDLGDEATQLAALVCTALGKGALDPDKGLSKDHFMFQARACACAVARATQAFHAAARRAPAAQALFVTLQKALAKDARAVRWPPDLIKFTAMLQFYGGQRSVECARGLTAQRESNKLRFSCVPRCARLRTGTGCTHPARLTRPPAGLGA